MKKITKILLPIASTVAAVAPMTCLASCSSSKYYEDVVTTNIQTGLIVPVSFEAKPANKATKVEAWLNSVSFPKGVETESGVIVTVITTNVKLISIGITGILKVSEKLDDGSTIHVNLHLIGYDAEDKVMWEESNSDFKIVHNSHVN